MMGAVTNRNLTVHESNVAAYEGLVEKLADGYDMCVYEYTNDLGCRQALEDQKQNPEVVAMWSRIELADRRLRQILRPTKACIHGNYPSDHFWFWGYPPNSPELEADLDQLGLL